MNTFSANSLKILDKSIEEFEKKYIFHLEHFQKNEAAKKGEKMHALICQYLRGFDMQKIEANLNSEEKDIFCSIKNTFKDRENFIKTEEGFLIKEARNDLVYYLTGRFDAIYFKDSKYTIYDWKSKTLPQNPEDDLQSIVYLYCASKIYETKKISICYFSLESKEQKVIEYNENADYAEKIYSIIKRLPKKYLV